MRTLYQPAALEEFREAIIWYIDAAGPFEVLTSVGDVDAAVLSDQVKSLDWKTRKAKKKATVGAEVMLHVRAKIKALLMIR